MTYNYAENVGDVKLHRATTGGKRKAHRDAEPEQLPMPRPISDGQSKLHEVVSRLPNDHRQ